MRRRLISLQYLISRRLTQILLLAIVAAGATGGGLIGRQVVSGSLAPFERFVIVEDPRGGISEADYHVKGKVVTVCSDHSGPGGVYEAGVCPLFWQLPADIRASAPDEVGTVAHIYCSQRNMGTYRSAEGEVRGQATQKYCVLTLTDPTGKVPYSGIVNFNGNAPPESVTVNKGDDAFPAALNPDDASFIGFIAELPRL